MGIFDRFFKKPAPKRRTWADNPHRHMRSEGFFSTDVGRLLTGWETQASSIDYYLQLELTELRARSRKACRANPYAKRYIKIVRSNVVGPCGVSVQAQTLRGQALDTPANDAIEAAFMLWGSKYCDWRGEATWVDLQNMAISCAAQDGEFLFRKHYGRGAGPHGFQLESLDPELLDTQQNKKTATGEIRLGVEYNQAGRIVRYHFRKRHKDGTYSVGDRYTVEARFIIHGYLAEWPDQSRGIPWMHAGLERMKHLEKYEESAIVKARSTAATMAVLSSNGESAYRGDIDDEATGATLDEYQAGTIKDIGDRTIQNLDSDYPHQMYGAFVKAHLQGIASGLGISYHALSNDLEGVNYSSIRAGVLEDRELFKGLQEWFIRSLVRPVYEEWLENAMLLRAITIGTRPLARPLDEYRPAHYQARRWAWVDPQKDGAANQMAINERLKSRSQIIRENGDDPESIWREIQREQSIMTQLGVMPITGGTSNVNNGAETQSNADS